jgi:polyketide biosynthesis acyl carrier protein
MTDVSRESIAAAVREAIMTVLPSLPASAITGDKHLRELGADSVDRVEIILTILDRFALKEPMSSFSRLPDVGALIDFVHERCR